MSSKGESKMKSSTCRILGSHSGGYEEFYLPGYKAMWSIESQLMFWRIMLPPFSMDYMVLYPRRKNSSKSSTVQKKYFKK
jgi:hypothetical protein